MKAMVKQRSHSIEFKRQVVAEHIAGESLYGLAKRHDLSRQLIRVWIEKYEWLAAWTKTPKLRICCG